MAKTNRWVPFITKLNQLTQDDQVRWDIKQQPDLVGSDLQQYGPAYVAQIDGATVRIYRAKIRALTQEEEEYWEDIANLEIKTSENSDFIKIPRTPGIEDLYESVVYKTNNVDQFLENFLNNR